MANQQSVSEAIEKSADLKPERNTLSLMLDRVDVRKRFEDMLGNKAPGFLSSILSAVALNGKLKEANPMSVISSAAIAASLDLPINPSLGFAHLVPYGGNAQFQMGWRGFVQLAMRSGQYQTMNVTEVYDGEISKMNRITGEIEFDEAKRVKDAKIIGYVAYFKLLNGFEKYHYMTKDECLKHGQKYSKSFGSQDGQWKNNPDAMSKKTVLKMLLSKFGILSIDMQRSIQFDQAVVKDLDGNADYLDNAEEVHAVDAPPSLPVTTEIGKEKTAQFANDISKCTTLKELDNVYNAFLATSGQGDITGLQYEELAQAMKDKKKELSKK